jgi:antitoxin VapB
MIGWEMTSTAKLFMHGRSQAVLLPEEFRLEGTDVRVSRVGDKVILEPMKKPPVDLDKFGRSSTRLGQGTTCPTVSLTIRRSNPIHASSSTNELPRLPKNAVRAETIFRCNFNVIWAVQTCRKKYCACPVGQISATSSPHPGPQRGVS